MESMLLPRYSLRTTLFGITLSAVFFLILGQAVRGHVWAIGIFVAVMSLFATLIVHAGFFALASGLGKVLGAQQPPARTSQGGLQTSVEELSVVPLSQEVEHEDAP